MYFQNRHRGNFIWECKQNEKTDTLWKTLSIVVVVVAAAALAFWANDPHQLKFRLWKNRFRTINWTLGPTTTTSLFVRFRFTNVLISFSIPFSSNPLSHSFSFMSLSLVQIYLSVSHIYFLFNFSSISFLSFLSLLPKCHHSFTSHYFSLSRFYIFMVFPFADDSRKTGPVSQNIFVYRW